MSWACAAGTERTLPMNPIRLIGLPTDCNSSFLRGPAKASAAIRAALFSDAGNPASESGAEIGQEIIFDDVGDLPLSETPGDDVLIEQAVATAIGDGYILFLLGGDHSVTYPVLRAVAAAHGSVEILHFDAHPDLYDELQGNRRSHASHLPQLT